MVWGVSEAPWYLKDAQRTAELSLRPPPEASVSQSTSPVDMQITHISDSASYSESVGGPRAGSSSSANKIHFPMYIQEK